MDICPVGAKLYHAGGRTDRHGEANSRFSQFCLKSLGISRLFRIVQAAAVRKRSLTGRNKAFIPSVYVYYYYSCSVCGELFTEIQTKST
jgi:hypothetical protein